MLRPADALLPDIWARFEARMADRPAHAVQHVNRTGAPVSGELPQGVRNVALVEQPNREKNPMPNTNTARRESLPAAAANPQTRCKSHPCPHQRAEGSNYCETHLELFARIRGEIQMDFKRGRPAHLGRRD
jgi:hypothetical protein